MEKIWVQASDKKAFSGRVACYERDPAHVTPDNPEGILDISPCSESRKGYEPRQVAGTPYVYDCIRQGKLVLVPTPEPEARVGRKAKTDD